MRQLLVLVLVVVCAQALRTRSRRTHALEENMKRRMVELEMERDRRGGHSDVEVGRLEERVHRGSGLRGTRAMNKRQTSQPIENCIQGDIIFVLDSSGSIKIENWKYVLDFVSQIVDKIGVGPQATRVGLVTFGNRAHIQFHLNNHTDATSMKQAIANTRFLDENTNTSGGIYTAHRIMFTPEHGDRPLAPNMAIVITDGVSTYDNVSTIPYAEQAKAAGIMMISIGVGDKTSQEELEGIASPGRTGKPLVFEVGGYDMLNLVRDKLANVACDVPDEEDENPACDPTTEVECIGLACKNKCKFGFQQDKNWCQTCACLAEPTPCP